MKIYLVGGAIRDGLLGHNIQERDWVVVGSTPEEMLALNFKPVGKDFPVFLHPKTHEEYALARTERKTGKGYKGFVFHTSPDVTLEEDLKRRDLTINAIALPKEAFINNEIDNSQLIDPYGGQADLENKLLRHVSDAFREDPVRILRIARFSARFPDFKIHEYTLRLMSEMVEAGEVEALVSERVWQEWSRALAEEQPIRFFETLEACGALKRLLPELNMNSEGMKMLETVRLDNALRNFQIELTKTEINPQEFNELHSISRFALLMHDLKADAIKNIGQRYRVPREYMELAVLLETHLKNYQLLEHHDAKSVLDLLTTTDALRRPERFEHFLILCETCSPSIPSKKLDLLNALEKIKSVDTQKLLAQGLQGKDFAEALHLERLEALSRRPLA